MVNSSPRLSYFFPLRETFLSGDERGETSAVRRLEFSMASHVRQQIFVVLEDFYR